MYVFQTTVFAKPDDAVAGETLTLRGQPLTTLTFERSTIGKPFELSFETAAENLQQLEQMDFEPDGYFLLTGGAGDVRWQIDGHLYDRNERLLMVNLKGMCPADTFDAILRSFGWPAIPLMFELTQEAVYLDETTFRKYALLRSS